MCGDEGQTNRLAPKRHRDARRGRDRDSRGYARDDFARDAVPAKRESFLATAREDEGIAALEPHHALALASQSRQQRIDLFLGHRVSPRRFAHVVKLDAIREIERNGRDGEPVVDDGVRVAQAAQPRDGEQARIAGARADQRDVPQGASTGQDLGGAEGGFFGLARDANIKQLVVDRGREEPIVACVRVGHGKSLGLHALAEALGGRDPARPRRPDLAFEHLAQPSHGKRRPSARGDTELQIAPLHERRQVEIAQVRDIRDVDPDTARPGRVSDLLIHAAVAGGDHDELARIHVGVDEFSLDQGDLALGGQLRDGLDRGRSNNRHRCMFREQALQLAIRDLPCPHEEAAAAAQVEHDRVHGTKTSFYHASSLFRRVVHGQTKQPTGRAFRPAMMARGLGKLLDLRHVVCLDEVPARQLRGPPAPS